VWDAGFVVTLAEPSPKLKLKVYGLVPPVAVAVNETAVPTVPVVGPDSETARVDGLMVTVADALAVTALESVAVTVIVLLPLTE